MTMAIAPYIAKARTMNGREILRWVRAGIDRRLFLLKHHYNGDGLATYGKNLGFKNDPRFAAAWHKAVEWAGQGQTPDVMWRTHVACWCASNAIRLPGDFVECGVATGVLSSAIVHYVDLENAEKRLHLYDTFCGIPTANLNDDEARVAESYNRAMYRDVWSIVSNTLGKLPYARLVRGELPGALVNAPDRIAYLSIDLNNATYERQVIERLWDRLVPGAHVLLDDYAFEGCAPQYAMWNEFATAHDRVVLSLPTGQGLLIR